MSKTKKRRPFPKHLVATYDWLLAGDELDYLRDIRGALLQEYAKEVTANYREHCREYGDDPEAIDAEAVIELGEWLFQGWLQEQEGV